MYQLSLFFRNYPQPFSPTCTKLEALNCVPGPVVKSLQILPLFPSNTSHNSRQKIINDLKEWSFTSKTWKWLDTVTYDQSNVTDAKLNILKNLNKMSSDGDVPKQTIMLAFLSGPKENAVDNKFRKEIKNLAASQNMASQCVQGITILKFKALGIISAVNAKAGGQNQICPGLAEKGTFFIAYDVSRYGGTSIDVGFGVFGFNGTVFQQAMGNRQKGEVLDESFSENSLREFLKQAKMIEHIQHVVVFRDGRFVQNMSKEVETLERVTNAYGMKATFVSVTKSAPGLFRMMRFEGEPTHSKHEPKLPIQKNLKFKVDMPHSGVFCSLKADTAILNTIGPGQIKDNYIGIPTGRALPKPLTITKIKGTASLNEIVEWVYHLSRLKSYSNRPTRLPAPQHLADRAAKDFLDGIIYPHVRGLHAA